MAVQRGSRHKKSIVKPEKVAPLTTKKENIGAKKTSYPKIVRAKTESKRKETMTEVQKALQTAQSEVRREHQARIRYEKALTEAWEILAAARFDAEQEHQTQKRRASFIVRLKLDEHGELGMTEIEHVSSGRKQRFLKPDGEYLITFMKLSTSSTITPGEVLPDTSSSEKIIASSSWILRPKYSLIISEVRVFRFQAPDLFTIVLTHGEPFIVEAHFRLQGQDAQFLSTQELFFEMRIYAREVNNCKSLLLTTYSAKLIQNVLEYTPITEVPGLSPGLYRLFTVINLDTPIRMACVYGKTVLHAI